MTLPPGRHAVVSVHDLEAGTSTVVLRTEQHVEAPSWSPDGRWLVLNADGALFRLPADGSGPLEPVELRGTPPINNDHVVAPDGGTVYVTGRDGHLYAAPFDGGVARRLTTAPAHGRLFKHYLHGVSADGRTLSLVGGGHDETGTWVTNLFTMSLDDGELRQLTDDPFADDGAELGPDGALWFNSDRAGHAQVFRMAADGTVEQVTDDERVNWFPHPSPDGRWVQYLSYPPGTQGHPPDRDVLLRLLPADARAADGARARDLVALRGGQGTSNVNGWAPDSRRFAYVAYPAG